MLVSQALAYHSLTDSPLELAVAHKGICWHLLTCELEVLLLRPQGGVVYIDIHTQEAAAGHKKQQREQLQA